MTVSNHDAAIDDHIANRAAVGAPNEMQQGVAGDEPRSGIEIVNHQVGKLAGLQRSNAIAHADRFCAGDGRQRECRIGAETFWIDATIASDAGSKCRSPMNVWQVRGIGRVTAERDAAAALDDIGMTARNRDSLSEAKVGPRAVGNGRSRCE